MENRGKPLGASSRALRSAARHPARSVLLAGIVALSACLLVSSLSTLTASVETQVEGAGAASGNYRLEFDVGNLRKRLNELPPEFNYIDENGNYSTKIPDNAFQSVLMGDVEKLSETEGVTRWNVVAVPVPALLPDMARIEDPKRDQTRDFGGVNIVGVRDQSQEQNVVSGNIELVDGAWVGPDDTGSVAISEELAELNGLSVGDEMEFVDAKDPESHAPTAARVCGIFRIVHDIPSTMTGDTYRSENTVFSDLAFSQEVAGCPDDPTYSYATFEVDDPAHYEAIGERLKSADIDWGRYQLVDDSGATARMSGNFNGLERTTWVFMASVAGCSIVLVALSMAFWAKTRRREAGILLSLGNARRAVVGQVVEEAVTLALAGCIAGCALAWPVSGIVAGTIVEKQVQQEAESARAEADRVAGGGEAAEKNVVGASASPDPLQACAVSAACIAVVAASSAAAVAPAVARGPRRALEKSE
ncbi:hypothetical protein C1878_00105 [Gordonibacter sp. 28C]|uniref:ABC transporter permease n=1 Tax=Gordonibacter sp. 28C TaxID=2078569 RepID=UPI000DF86477|nr:FtsX-like permease family protein [Gordonibacter sp. 28C]RDB64309.1 hypothetical protein C1878_00105 [Gordonibacter sp. 28C]